jgi:aminoglycoside phosphotransferase (APT) family kinase protein
MRSDWRGLLLAWLKGHAAALGLDAPRVEVERVVNPTGWHANVACTITDGSTSLHAKLSRDHAEMAKVYNVSGLLTSRYRMPPILAWIDVGEFVGFAMPSIPSQPATEELIPSVIELADGLHRDAELAAALLEDEQPDTFREAFLDVWIERFTTDLDELETGKKVPPFVTASTMDWMREETARLADMTDVTSFDAEPTGPVHGDLHLANVLVEPGTWWLIDWDDLHRGDPAADLAMLFSPLIERGESFDELVGERDKAFAERFAVCQRAVVLDLVIDSLADWADADQAPDAAPSIRATKRRVHERGLAMYRERYAT